MIYETKAGEIGGSITTVFPSAIAKLLKIKKGSKIRWITEITDHGVLLTVEPIDKKE